MLKKKSIIFILTILCFGAFESLIAQEKKKSAYNFNGLLFGDIYYVQKHHLEDSSQKAGAVIRRVYLTFNAKFNKHWFGRFRLEINQSGEFYNYSFETQIKDLFIGYKAGKHKILVGRSPTRAFDLIENVWGLRYLTKSTLDLQGVSSRDFGISANGPLNAKNTFQYRTMIGMGQDFKNDYGDGLKSMLAITWKPTSKWYVDAYTEYERLPGHTDRIGLQFFAGYLSEGLRWGIQYTNQYRQDDPGIELVSGFLITNIYKKIGLIYRFDRLLKPSPRGDGIDYLPFDPTAKATLLISGIEFEITKHFFITPNIVFITYDENDLGRRPESDLLYRLTLFFNF